MPPLRIGYVPEHFSSPLLQLAAKSTKIELVSCPSGTGQLTSALKDNTIDVAIALTEALINGIVKKTAPYKLVGTYVTTPLNWAVIVGKDSPYKKLSDVRGKPVGISRFGSGSHIMANCLYLREGWVDAKGNVEPIDFVYLDTFKNLRDGVNDGRAAFFMWEHFTTKPYLSEVNFIDHILTPWSSWMIAASDKCRADSSSELKDFLGELSASIKAFDNAEARETTSLEFIKSHFSYPTQDVQDWLKQVGYPSAVTSVAKEEVEKTLDTLVKAGVIEKPPQGWDLTDFVDTSFSGLA